MISLKAIQTSFTICKHEYFQNRELSNRKNSHRHHRKLFCKSKDNQDANAQEPPPPEGDIAQQELLARIAMIQAEKVRLTDYLDEKSAYLTKFAEEANAEFDQVGENALKELDEASARIMQNIEGQMQAFEESAEVSKMEIEENEKKLEEFEDRIENERNEGLFFKNLRRTKPSDKAMAKAEAEKIKEITKESAGSETRRNIYLGLISLVGISIVDSLISPSTDLRKVAVLGVILVGLLSQFTYEQKMSETERQKTDKDKENKE